MQAGELWIPGAAMGKARLVVGRRVTTGEQLGDIEWLRSGDFPNDSATLQPISRIKDAFGLALENFAHADSGVDPRYGRLTVFAGNTGDTSSTGHLEFKVAHADNTTHTLKAKILKIGGVKKGFSLEGAISAPDLLRVGTLAVSLSAEATKTAAVNFATALQNVPLVLVTKGTGFTGQLDVRLASAAEGGFEATVYTHDGSNATASVTVNWAAICSSAYA